jgi:RNA polymerase sigma factor, sigma-70 family
VDTVYLVAKARGGDKEALLNLIMDKKSEYYKLAYVYTGNKDDALDAMEDMIAAVYGQIGSLRKADVFYSWSKTILANCCRDIIRKRNRTAALDDMVETGCSAGYEERERNIDIMNYLKKLNEGQQEAIKLKYFMDMDYETIAKISKVPVGTVKSRISTGLKRLRECFGGEY